MGNLSTLLSRGPAACSLTPYCRNCPFCFLSNGDKAPLPSHLTYPAAP
jgi:hypothetical protein